MRLRVTVEKISDAPDYDVLSKHGLLFPQDTPSDVITSVVQDTLTRLKEEEA